MKKKQNSKNVKVRKLENLKQINFNAAGIDIGSSEIYVCVPEGRDTEPVKHFGTFTCELNEISDWLKKCGVDTVAMESTGVYWVPLYEILESNGFKVYLVNARHVKNVPGRKTDTLDCQWLQQLHTYGLLSGSFHPEKEIAELRSLVRHRENLISYRSSHIQHMQKSLHLMNIQLDNVIGDITGYTGMKIIRDIVDGERNPKELASYRDPRCKKSEEDIAKSLEGNYKAEYIFQLKQSLDLYDYYGQLIKDCDLEIKKKYSQFTYKLTDEEQEKLAEIVIKRIPKKNEPNFDLHGYLYKICGVDLTKIDGLNVLSVQTIISEIGVDMSKWPSEHHFTSWLGLCPYNDISGGKVLKTRTKKTKNKANKALRMAAQSLYRSKSALGAFYRRMKARLGPAKAITATAHKIARIIYSMLKSQTEYNDPGANYYEEKYKERAIKNLKRKASQLGLQIVEGTV